MLDGVGISELAACAGLSDGHVNNILKHSHARNNRAVLFALKCAFVLHVIDKITEEDPALDEVLRSKLRKETNNKAVTTEGGRPLTSTGQGTSTEKKGLFAKSIDGIS